MRPGALPEKFPKAYFKAHGGINYFVITHEDSTNYLAQIALTNRHHAAIGGLSDFVHTVNHATTNSHSRATLAAVYWKLGEDRGLTLTTWAKTITGGFCGPTAVFSNAGKLP